MNEPNIFFTGMMLGIIISCFGALAICAEVDKNEVKTMCRQLYSKTINYEACTNKSFQDIARLIKPIDTEVEE